MSNITNTQRVNADEGDNARPETSGHRVQTALNPVASPENERKHATSAGVLHSTDTEAGPNKAGHTWNVDVGVDVVASCGHKIGEVVDVRDSYVIVEKGFFIPEDVYVPKSAIAEVDDHHLKLNVSKDSIEHSDWDEDPDDEPAAETGNANVS